MTAYHRVRLVPATRARARQLWLLARNHPAWPHDFTTLDAWLHHTRASAIAERMGGGALRIIEVDGDMAGFVSKAMVDPSFLPVDVFAMECGTFLLPQHRGTGLNGRVKRMWLSEIFEAENVEFCLFVIAQDNLQAAKGLARLHMPVSLSTGTSKGPFSKLAKRKSWEQGKPCEVYALSRRDFDQWLTHPRSP